MKTLPAATFRFSIAAILLLTAGVAFLASALIATQHTESPTPPLIVNTLPFRGSPPFVDSIDSTPSVTQAEMERLIDKRMSSIYQSLAAAIAEALGDGTIDVVVSRVFRTAPDGPLTVDATWRGSSTPHVLKLHRIESNIFGASASSTDGSPDLVLTMDLTGTELADEAYMLNSR